MEIVLLAIAVNVLTWICKKLKLSGAYASVLLSLIGGTIYFVINTYYPVTRETVSAILIKIFGISQAVYLFLKKTGILDKLETISFSSPTISDEVLEEKITSIVTNILNQNKDVLKK